MATKLEIYNEALRLVGDLRLVATTDQVEARYALDDAWSRAVLFCGAQADWPFAMAVIQPLLDSDSSIGYNKSYTFDPSVWLRTVAVSLDENFAVQAHYMQTATKFRFKTSETRAYFRYISKDMLQDTDVPNWPEMFCSVVAHRLAFDICERLTQDPQKAQGLYQLFVEVLGLAKSQHAPEMGGMMISPAQWAAKVHNDTVAAIWEEAIRLMGTGDPKIAMVQRPVDAKPVHEVLEMAWRGVVLYCLNEFGWNFATNTALLSSSAGSGIGYSHSFAKPADWLRTVDVAGGGDDDFKSPIDYRDERGRWYVNSSSINVRYVSTNYAQDADSYLWPDNFKRLIACRLAYECVDLVTGIPDKRPALEKEYSVQVARAITIDAGSNSLAIPKRRNAAVGSVWSEALRLIGYVEGAKGNAEKDDEADRVYRILDTAWSRVVKFCLTEHYWNFATTTVSISSSGVPSLGYSYGFNKPSDWLRTISIARDGAFSANIEYSDQGNRFSANERPIYVRYISSSYATDGSASSWPEQFIRVVAYRLAYECSDSVTGDQARRQVLLEEYKLALDSAAKKDAADKSAVIPNRRNSVISSIWKEAARLIGYKEAGKTLPDDKVTIEGVYQIFDEAWQGVVKHCLTEGYWNFATDIISIASSGSAELGYAYGFAKPATWLRTINVAADNDFSNYIEYRDQAGRFYANVTPLKLRYITSSVASDGSATSWPESFKRVLAYRLAYEVVEPITGDPNRRAALFEEYKSVLASSLEKDAADDTLTVPKRRNDTITAIWQEALRLVGYADTRKASVEKRTDRDAVYQILDNAWPRIVKFCLTEGYWNFATSIASIANSNPTSTGFTYGFAKPNDWLRTVSVSADTSFSTSVEYRDQGGRFYANVTPLYIRFISASYAEDNQSSTWPEVFCRVLAYRLAYEVVEPITGDPNRREGLLKEYKLVLSESAEKDAADQSLVIPKRRNSTITAIWKEAARLIGFAETKKSTLETEVSTDGVYQIFDDAWQRVVRFCLTEGLWNFATKTSQITQSGVPIPGWQYAFNKPSGWLRTIAVSNSSEFFAEARYHDEGGKLYSNDSTLYIRFMSSDYGADAEAPNWPEMFCRVLAYRLAYECSDAVTGDPNRSTKLMADYKSMLAQAKGKDAMDQAQMFPRTSNWLGAMRGVSNRRYDRGSLSGF